MTKKNSTPSKGRFSYDLNWRQFGKTLPAWLSFQKLFKYILPTNPTSKSYALKSNCCVLYFILRHPNYFYRSTVVDMQSDFPPGIREIPITLTSTTYNQMLQQKYAEQTTTNQLGHQNSGNCTNSKKMREFDTAQWADKNLTAKPYCSGIKKLLKWVITDNSGSFRNITFLFLYFSYESYK